HRAEPVGLVSSTRLYSRGWLPPTGPGFSDCSKTPTIDPTWRSSTPVRPMRGRICSAAKCSMGVPGRESILSRGSISKQEGLCNSVRSCRSIHQHLKTDTCALRASRETTRLLLTESLTTEEHRDRGLAMVPFCRVFHDRFEPSGSSWRKLAGTPSSTWDQHFL